MTLANHTGYINVDTLAAMFKLPSWDKTDECNIEYIWETGQYAYSEALKEGKSEAEAEESREEAERIESEDMFHKWHRAVTVAVGQMFEKHGLALKPRRKGEAYPFEYKIVALAGWKDAADKIIDTINGVGYFHFGTVRDFISSGPYRTARQAVLHHVGWIPDHAEVYGTSSARMIYETYLR